ncbi:golgin subfamily A member 7/ERF4 family domain-containing protein [Trichoderma breve]|uniref:Ras modification protein ERF4 n=1 Tax=Trichoderma breve TaxID=2034170 RepID=A0A9W9BFI6_9HYPO|nr:golgin subfamily A member 7/ERF4 family domain-containing protein [Trichoderma breve]KAJ4860424.1 golgin subfamily A member 7/ERF4 family domain-containing protein [Trichoderma breve]
MDARRDLAISSLRGRPSGRAVSTIPTASYELQAISTATGPPSLGAQVNPRSDAVPASPSASHQPPRPDASKVTEPASPQPVLHKRNQHSIFRSLTTSATGPTRLQRLSSARLWNPTNSTPRAPSHKRRPSSPIGPPVPLQHPALDQSTDTADPNVTGAGDYPLLTLTEHRQVRHSSSTPLSFQFDLNTTDNKRISLPGSTRTSGDYTGESPPPTNNPKVDKGKGIMLPENEEPRRSYSRDLERGPDVMDNHRFSNVSLGDGIGSAISSSNSSIMGEEIQPDLGESWGPQHPCFPHLNPHVPSDSAEYAKTRIIRIRRDWLLQGDLAPTFSNLYPEILDPAGIPEPEFRRIIDKLNKELVPAFDPYNPRNVLDAVLGLVTGWLWDDFGMTGIKSRLNNLELWIEKWNREKEKTTPSEEGILPPKLISLRRTGYMTLDIQIPDPEIAPAPSSTGAAESIAAMPLEPAPVLVA